MDHRRAETPDDPAGEAYLPVKRFWKNRGGAAVVEYAFVVALIALATMAGMTQLGDAFNWLFGSEESQLIQALGANRS